MPPGAFVTDFHAQVPVPIAPIVTISIPGTNIPGSRSEPGGVPGRLALHTLALPHVALHAGLQVTPGPSCCAIPPPGVPDTPGATVIPGAAVLPPDPAADPVIPGDTVLPPDPAADPAMAPVMAATTPAPSWRLRAVF